jgi:4-hydroxybenzoate polyprenyltransferase
MKKIIVFFKLIRLGNVLMVFFTLPFAYFFLTDYVLPEDLLRLRFLSLCMAVSITAAAGYIINDYYDIKIDLINKPQKNVVGSVISRRLAMTMHVVMSLLAFLFASYAGLKMLFVVFMSMLLLIVYSFSLKKSFLWGNIAVAFLSAWVIIILKIFDSRVSFWYILSYAVFAFIISLIREIVKDIEDMKGDAQFSSKSLPVSVGIPRSKTVMYFLTALLAACIILFGTMHMNVHIEMTLYLFIGVLVPLGYATFLLYHSDTKKQFSKLSKVYKILMLLGIASMIWV